MQTQHLYFLCYPKKQQKMWLVLELTWLRELKKVQTWRSTWISKISWLKNLLLLAHILADLFVTLRVFYKAQIPLQQKYTPIITSHCFRMSEDSADHEAQAEWKLGNNMSEESKLTEGGVPLVMMSAYQYNKQGPKRLPDVSLYKISFFYWK